MGSAIHDTLHPDWGKMGTDEMNEDVLYAGNPFIVSWFEIEEEYRKKRLLLGVGPNSMDLLDCENLEEAEAKMRDESEKQGSFRKVLSNTLKQKDS